jgi:hypothetical protein
MCGGRSTQKADDPNSCTPLVPDPTETLVGQNLPDGYWLEAFYFHKNDKYPDLIGYGLGSEDTPSSITLFVNPQNLQYVDGAWLNYCS